MGAVCGCEGKQPLLKEEREKIKAFTASQSTRNVILQLEIFQNDVKKINQTTLSSYLDVFHEILESKNSTMQQRCQTMYLVNAALMNNTTSPALLKKHPLLKLIIKHANEAIQENCIQSYDPTINYSWKNRYSCIIFEFLENAFKNFSNEIPDIKKFYHTNAKLLPRPSNYLRINSNSIKETDTKISILNRRLAQPTSIREN